MWKNKSHINQTIILYVILFLRQNKFNLVIFLQNTIIYFENLLLFMYSFAVKIFNQYATDCLFRIKDLIEYLYNKKDKQI